MRSFPPIDQSGAPEGYRYEWATETGPQRWEVTGAATYRCRWTDEGVRCPNLAVAILWRGPHQPWGYCPEHLFGRVLVDGVVYGKRLVKVDERAKGDG